MKVIKSYLTNNACYKANRTITVRGLMLHSVGCNQPSAEVFAKKWNDPDMTRKICCHGMIDGNTGDVRQFLPWNHRGWHGASGKNGSCNNTHIGVEMCEPACIEYTGGSTFICHDKPAARKVAQRTYDSAVQLFAMLCKEFGLDPLKDGVIISHKEGHRRGLASNHGDPEHLWTQLDMGLTMDTFRQAVKAAMSGATDVPAKDNDVPTTDTAQDVPFVVRVAIDDLRIRKGPGTNYEKTGRYTGKGAFTIVEVRPGEGSEKGWGLLKSEAGWIALDAVQMPGQSQPVNRVVRVRTDDVAIYTGPGTNYEKTGRYTGEGAFTIVQVQPGEGSKKGWGKLKSGAGWIALDWTEQA